MSESVRVAKLPTCDVCKYEYNRTVEAQYDARTIYGPWGYVCEEHFRSHTEGRLGTGYGQRLEVAS